MAHLYGSLMSLLQADETRIEGILASINVEAATITLTDVTLFGTEDRPCATFVPCLSQTFPSMTINRSQVKSMSKLLVRSEPPTVQPPPVAVAPQQTETQTQASTTPASEQSANTQKSQTTTDDNFQFNTQALNINRDQPTTQKAYDPAGFFDTTGHQTVRPQYSNMDTFGENLRRQNRRPPQQQNRRNNNGGNYGGNNNNNYGGNRPGQYQNRQNNYEFRDSRDGDRRNGGGNHNDNSSRGYNRNHNNNNNNGNHHRRNNNHSNNNNNE